MKRVVLFMVVGASCASPQPAQPEPVSFDEAPVMEPEAGPAEPVDTGFSPDAAVDAGVVVVPDAAVDAGPALPDAGPTDAGR